MATDTQVLVVGAGPVGLFMAAELRRHGVSCRIVDKNDGPTNDTRAADELDTAFPFILQLPQSQTERLLAAYLARLGTKAERGVELVAFEQGGGGVRATLRSRDDSQETVNAAYLVGCDGAHSTVRHALGISFSGDAYPTDLISADVKVDWKLPKDEQMSFFAPEGMLTFFPLAGGRAAIVADLGPAKGDHPPAAPTLEALQALFNARTPGGVLSDPIWNVCYRVHCRQAERYQVGRVFLVGDAAHVCSNIGGQGMNTGMQDAYNLGWKLGLVVNGRSPPSLVDSYQPERHQAGQDMLCLSDHLHRIALREELHLSLPETVRQRLAEILASQDVMQQRMRRAVAELNIGYRHSPLIAEHHHFLPGTDGAHAGALGWHDFGAGPRAGDRAVDAPLVLHPGREPVRLFKRLRRTTHHVLLFAGAHATPETHQRLQTLADDITRTYAGRVATHLIVAHQLSGDLAGQGDILLDPRGELHHRYGARSACLYVVRPDGYIGFRSQPTDAEALKAYFTRIFL